MLFESKEFTINDCKILKATITEKGKWFGLYCGTLATTRAAMQGQLAKKEGGYDVDYLNGNKNIVSNHNLCGQVILGGTHIMNQEWEVGVDNITEDDINEYHEHLKTTPQYGHIDYNMDVGIMRLYPDYSGFYEWREGNTLGYLLNVPIHKTVADEDNTDCLIIQNPVEFGYRQIDIAPNSEFDLIKKEEENYPNECYFYVQNECEIGAFSFDKDTFRQQVSTSLTIKNLTDKPNRIVQIWRRYKPNYGITNQETTNEGS